MFNAIKDQLGSGARVDRSCRTRRGPDLGSIAPSMAGWAISPSTAGHLQDLVNRGYFREFILNSGQLSEFKMQRKPSPLAGQVGNTLIQYKEVRHLSTEGTTLKERAIYVNEAQRDNCPTMLTRSPSPLGRAIFFSKADAYVVYFPHNDALVMTMHIGCCQVSKILVERGE